MAINHRPGSSTPLDVLPLIVMLALVSFFFFSSKTTCLSAVFREDNVSAVVCQLCAVIIIIIDIMVLTRIYVKEAVIFGESVVGDGVDEGVFGEARKRF